MVMLDRWIRVPFASSWLRSAWCSAATLCSSAFPPYFLVILVFTVGAIAIAFAVGPRSRPEVSQSALSELTSVAPVWQRRLSGLLVVIAALGALATVVEGLVPAAGVRVSYGPFLACLLLGGALQHVNWGALPKWLKAHAAPITAQLLGFAAFTRTIWELVRVGTIGPISLILIAVAAFSLARLWRQVSSGYWLFLLACVVFSLELRAYYFAFVGDEYAFYNAARYISQQITLSDFSANLFDGTYVYQTHPFISSALQAMIMRLYDNEVFGWRFSSILASALAVAAFYYFLRTFLERWVAFVAAFLIAASHYLMSFSRIGYNSTQALLAMGLALAAASFAIKSGRRLAWSLTGIALGFCFFVFPAALFVPPLVALLLLMYRPPGPGSRLLDWAALVLAALFMVLPLLFQADYWSSKLGGTVLESETGVSSPTQLVPHLLGQLGYAFYAFLYTIQESHFVTVAHVDFLTAALVLLGIGSVLRVAAADKFARFAVVSYAYLLLVVGAAHQYEFPPTTRMFMLVPWYGLLAALGIRWIVAQLLPRPVPFQVGVVGLALGLGVVLGLNLFQAYVISVDRTRCCRNYVTSFVQLGQNLASQTGAGPATVLVVDRPGQVDMALLRQIVAANYLAQPMEEIALEPSGAPPAGSILLAGDQVVVLSPELDVGQRRDSEDKLRSAGWQSCPLISVSAYHGIDVWYPLAMPPPCTQMPARRAWSWLVPALLALAAGALSSIALAGRKLSDWRSSLSVIASVVTRWRPVMPKNPATPRLKRGVPKRPAVARTPTQPPRMDTAGEPLRRRDRRSLAFLGLALMGGIISVWALRQPWSLTAAWPWLLLLASMFSAAFALRSLKAWDSVALVAHSPAGTPSRRRRMAGSLLIAFALMLDLLVVCRLWPDYHNRWQGSPPIWLAALALLITGSWLLGSIGDSATRAATARSLWPDIRLYHYIELAAFVLILALGIFLRLYHLESVPPGIYGDETFGGVEALYILQGRLVSPFATGWGWVPNGYYYFMAFVLRLFGANWIGLKAASLIPALLTLPATYVLGRMLFGRLTGLTAMALLATNRWHFSYSRWGWMETVPPLIQVLAFFFLIRGLRDRRALDFGLSGLLAGLGIYTYFGARLTALTLMVYAALWILSSMTGKDGRRRSNWHGIAFAAVVAVAVLAPLAVTFMKDPPLFSQHVDDISIMQFVRHQGSAKPLLDNLKQDLQLFHQVGAGDGRLNLPREPMLDPITGLLFAIGIALATITPRDHRSVLLTLWIVIAMAGSYLSDQSYGLNTYRSLSAVPGICLLAANALVTLAIVAHRIALAGPRRLHLAYWSRAAPITVILLSVAGVCWWEFNVYFDRQAANIEVLRAFHPAPTRVARAMAHALTMGKSVYVASRDFYDNSIVRFMAYDVAAANGNDNPLDERPYHRALPEIDLPLSADGNDAVLLLNPDYWSLMDYFTGLYPGSTSELVTLPDGSPLYVRVDVSAAQIAALQGLRETITLADGGQITRLSATAQFEDATQALQEVNWNGLIRIPRSGDYTLSGQGELLIYIDGELCQGPRYLGRGLYDIHVVRPGAAKGATRLMWQLTGGEAAPVPKSALYVIDRSREGLTASYWDNTNWQGTPLFTQTIPFLFQTWPSGSELTPVNAFSARYTGSLRILEPAMYVLRLEADDGARLTLDGKLIAEGLISGRENDFEATVPLSAGEHPVQIDYFQADGSSALRFYWRHGDGTFEPVPPSALVPSTP
jgi:hypothetical protein